MLSVLEDSLDAATGQARSWERALASPSFTITQVAEGSERRLLANLRGLARADAVVREELLRPALDADDARAFVAALALLEGGGDVVPGLLERLGSPEAPPPLLRALSLTGNPRVEVALRSLVAEEKDATRLAMALEVLAFRRADAGVDVRGLPAGGSPRVAAAALWVAHGSASSVLACNFAEGMLQAADAGVRAAAIEVALIHGSKPAWDAAREVVDAGEASSGVALLALAISGDGSDVLRLVKLADVDAHRPAALFALGFTGSPLALEVCLAAMAEARSARVAAEAFTAITGLKMVGQYSRAEARKKPGGPVLPLEEEDLDANLVPGLEAELPVPEVGAVKQWWAGNKSRFSADARYLGGVPLDGARLLEGFRGGLARRRPGLGLELAIRTRGKWRVETRQWARAQLSMQAASVAPPVMSPFGALLD